jgi:hypothetical protein
MNVEQAKREFYAKVAKLILKNPDKTYQQLMAEYSLSYRSMLNAVHQEGIKRPRGRRPRK